MAPSEVVVAARAWADQDPDADTRAELEALIRASATDGAAAADLAERFSGRLQFGTAGLRGPLGAGPMRMNRVLVAQAAAGLAAYLRAQIPDRRPIVVIGYDGRRNSDVFAHDSAELFAGAGLRAILLPRLLPTPVLAFAVRHLRADAGVMVTASHNPPADNGYKVYLGGEHGGSQIVPPADAAIAAEISRVATDQAVPDLPRSEAYEIAGEDVVDAYVSATASVAPAPTAARGMTWAYTAMHGVGWETFARVLDEAGYPRPAVAAAQIEPDGVFPTVSFPNPEEPGAMDLLFEAGTVAGAEIALAHDPDADRLAVAIPDGDDGAGGTGWRRLTGNEIGLVLGLRAARAVRRDDVRAPDRVSAEDDAAAPALACSLVSSPGLGAIAERYGLAWFETLTGFKWISRAPGIVFGFEEALGYLVNPGTVRDKDGVSAAVAVLGLAAEARGQGRTFADLLDEVANEIGHFASGQVSIRVEDVSIIDRTMARLREEPPTVFGAVAVERSDDLLRSAGADADDAGTPDGDILRYLLADGSRVIFRPSGTEPKLKAYLDVRGDDPEDADARLAALETAVRKLLSALS